VLCCIVFSTIDCFFGLSPNVTVNAQCLSYKKNSFFGLRACVVQNTVWRFILTTKPASLTHSLTHPQQHYTLYIVHTEIYNRNVRLWRKIYNGKRFVTDSVACFMSSLDTLNGNMYIYIYITSLKMVTWFGEICRSSLHVHTYTYTIYMNTMKTGIKPTWNVLIVNCITNSCNWNTRVCIYIYVYVYIYIYIYTHTHTLIWMIQ